MGIRADAFVTEKLASSKRSPGDSATKETSEISGKVSEIRSTIQHRREYEEGRRGTSTGNEIFVANPKKLELNLTGSGISKKAADIINSIRQSSYNNTSSKLEPFEGSGKSSRFDNCKDFLKRSNAPIPFDASSTSKPSKSFPASKSIPNLGSVLVENKGCLTEVHSGTQTNNNTTSKNHSVSVGAGDDHNSRLSEDEVEIVSLLEEQVPRYKLRADTLTKFSGYPNEDFVGIPFPVLKDFSPVTPEQAYLTLGYFLICGERVSQMTKTYSDPESLQKLLEEKERDVELAARIGQQLLEENQALEEKVTILETEARDNIDNITQLKHELNFKAQLLELYNDNNDPTESAETSKAGTPVGSVATVLERRLQMLETENKALRQEACELAEDVEKTEAQEKCLVEDAISRLNESNDRLYKLTDELERKGDEVKSQQEDIVCLEHDLKLLKEENFELVNENIELRKVVDVLNTNQSELGTEIIDLKENYVEVVAILKETQEQLREAQKKKDEGADVITVFDSLAYEIDSSVARQRKSSDYFRRTFDTVRCANSKITDPSNTSALVSSGSVSGFGSSGLLSLDSSSSHELVNSNFNSLIMESGLGSLCHSPGGSSTPGSSWRLPEKLQIIKPLEGSSTLQIWSNLATPHLGNLLEKRPGVESRVERTIEGISPNTLLPLLADTNTVVASSTPAVFTFVTTLSNRDSTNTIFSSHNMSSTLSTCSLSSVPSTFDHSSPSPILTPTSRDKERLPSTGDYLKLCETPQNSPLDGNSRPMSPSMFHSGDQAKASSSRTLKTLYAVYDTLCSKIGDLRNPSSRTPSQKYDLTTKLGSVEVSFESSRLQACPKPGTGILQKILLEPD